MSAIDHRVPASGHEIGKSNPNVMLSCELASKGVDDSEAMECLGVAERDRPMAILTSFDVRHFQLFSYQTGLALFLLPLIP